MVELSECFNFLLSRAQLVVNKEFKIQLGEYDITPVQCGVLNCLYKEDGQGLKALSEKVSVNASTMTGVIDRMEAKGIIERRPDPNDRRAQGVFLTDKGYELEETATNTILEANKLVLDDYSDEQVDLLLGILKDLGDKRA